ncbi:MAG: glycosyl hydrolase [Acidobacteria bacterium]|nr:glycosyl hydrolase [Acidobacteriota bacterium]
MTSLQALRSSCFLLLPALLAASDVKPFAAWEYRAIGPANMGGRTADVEGVPGKPAIVYAGTGGGGVWKTVNGGTTWSPLWEREGSYSVGDLALDPRNPDVVWLGSGEANMRNSVSFGDGVYKSTDGGRNWRHLGLRDTEHIARVLVSPLDSNTAWVCAVGRQAAPNPERGVFLTTDGGATWQKTLYLDDRHGCADLDLNPANPNILYAAMWRFERKPWNHTSGGEKTGLYKSTDGGRTWQRLEQGLPKLLGRVGVKVAPSRPDTVYAATESNEGTLYRSTDAGATWQEMTRERDVVARGFYYADIRVDPRDENRVYSLATNLQVSIDAGRTWRNIGGRTHSDYHALWIDPLDPARLWQGQDGGLAVSYDRGDTWEAVLYIPLGQFYQIHADNRAPFYNITGGLQDNGTYTGPSRTRPNQGILNSDWQLLSFGDGFYAYSHPDEPDVFLSESQGGSILRSDFRSGEQQSISPQPRSGRVWELKYRFNWNTPIVGSPHGKNSVFFGGNALFQTRDFGRSWEPISGDLTTNNPDRLKPAGGPVWRDNSTAENYCTIISVNESPAKAGVIWVGTDDGNVQVTANGGQSWTNVARNVPGIPEGSPVSHVEPSRTAAATAYVAFDRHLLDDYRPHLFKTTDNGASFTRISGNLPANAYVHIVREDPRNPSLLYAGTELGLYASFDGGANWQPLLLKNMPKVAIHDILIHPRENDLILATHGRSILVLDDITPLQQFSPEIAAKAAHLFPARPSWRFATPMRSYGLGNKAYAGPNPPYGAILSYYLKEKLDAKAALKLEILDSAGTLIRTVDKLPRAAGVNRVAWDLRHDGPALRTPPRPQEIEFGGGPRGPFAVPGIYTARLTAAGLTLETKVEVKLDPALKASPQDLAAARDTALRTETMVSALNSALKRIDGLRTQLQAIPKTAREQLPARADEWTRATAPMLEELEKVSGELGIRPGGNRLEDSPRLAEDLAALLGQLTSAQSAPTSAQTAYLAELEKRYTLGISAANGLLAKAGSQWNPALQKLGAPALVAAGPIPVQ